MNEIEKMLKDTLDAIERLRAMTDWQAAREIAPELASRCE